MDFVKFLDSKCGKKSKQRPKAIEMMRVLKPLVEEFQKSKLINEACDGPIQTAMAVLIATGEHDTYDRFMEEAFRNIVQEYVQRQYGVLIEYSGCCEHWGVDRYEDDRF